MILGTAKKFDDACIKVEPKRGYLGASAIGDECDRKLWYTFHTWIDQTDPRVQRIFDMGNLIEEYIIKKLKEAGFTVWTDLDGKQFGFTDGNIGGHCDGVISGLPESSVPHLLEVKSANSKRFAEFKEKGVRAVSMTYYVQCIVYMLKFKLTRCLFVMMNKDTQEIYFERIEANDKTAIMYLDRAKEITVSSIPERKYLSASFYKCKFCNFREECWYGTSNAE